MKTVTKVLAAIVSAVALAAQVPAVQSAVSGFLSAHVGIAAIVGAISTILALFHQPDAPKS